MRFWRSVQPGSKKAPKAVVEKAASLKKKRGGLLALYEDWLQSREDWGASCIVQRLCKGRAERYKGRFKYFTREELVQRYRDASLVEDLCQRKADVHVAV